MQKYDIHELARLTKPIMTMLAGHITSAEGKMVQLRFATEKNAACFVSAVQRWRNDPDTTLYDGITCTRRACIVFAQDYLSCVINLDHITLDA